MSESRIFRDWERAGYLERPSYQTLPRVEGAPVEESPFARRVRETRLREAEGAVLPRADAASVAAGPAVA